jgi:1-acylglycerone phosphate reductase
MELKPLNVKVLTVITGTIKTNLNQNSTKMTLPAHSIYEPVEEHLDKMRQGLAHPNGTDPSDYAQQVVGDILRGVTGNIWRGANTTLTRYLTPTLPTSIKVMSLSYRLLSSR